MSKDKVIPIQMAEYPALTIMKWWACCEADGDIHVYPCDEKGNMLVGHRADISCECIPYVKDNSFLLRKRRITHRVEN